MRPRKAVSFVLPLSVVSLLLAACGSGKPADPAPAGADVRAMPRSNPSTVPSSTNGATADVADIWSGDLDAINEHVRRTGLLGDVYFDYDDAELSQAARERLAANARFLAERRELVVTVEGHCDERGTAEYNLALGDRRSHSAIRYLQSLGIGDGRLRPMSYGKERPACTATSESCWSKNRRAQFVITGRNRAS